MYVCIYLSLYGSTILVDFGSFFSFLIYIQSVGVLGRGISPSQGRYLHTEQHNARINAHRHPCLEWDLNPRPQCSSSWRRFMAGEIVWYLPKLQLNTLYTIPHKIIYNTDFRLSVLLTVFPFLCCWTRWYGWCTTFWVQCSYWSRRDKSRHSLFALRRRNLQIRRNSATLYTSALKMEAVCTVTAQSTCPITYSDFRFIFFVYFNSTRYLFTLFQGCRKVLQKLGNFRRFFVLFMTNKDLRTEEPFGIL
jgi:hypothetical protein